MEINHIFKNINLIHESNMFENAEDENNGKKLELLNLSNISYVLPGIFGGHKVLLFSW